MDSQRNQRLQSEILSELKVRGFQNWTENAETPEEAVSEFEVPPALSSDTYPANVREPEIEMEIVDMVNEISLPEYEASEILQSVTRDLNTVFGSMNIRLQLLNGERVTITNQWKLYGSYSNGLCCNDSDIDFHNGSFENLVNFDAGSIVKLVWDVLKNNSYFDLIRYFPTAQVPLVELIHRRTGRVCSITFSGVMGVYDSLLAKQYVEQNSNLKILTLFLKYVLVRHGLHGTGKITTHTIFWLVVFFMQQKKLLLPVNDVREAAVREENNVSNWNYSDPDGFPVLGQAGYSSKESIVSLYRGFLEFYKSFNFLKYVISPYVGYAIPIEHFEKFDKPFTKSFMNIQNMFSLTTNLAANVSLKAVNDFRVVCEHLFINCEKALNEGHPFDVSSESELKSMKDLYKNINQTACIDLDFKYFEARVVDLKESVIAAVSNLMEIVLGFQCVKLVGRDVIRVDHDPYYKRGDPVKNRVPVLYVEYSTTYATLNNKYVLSMFEESSGLSENFGIFYLFEIRNDLHCVRVLVEGDGRFVEFIKFHGKELFLAQV